MARRSRFLLGCTAAMALALSATTAQAQQRIFNIPAQDARRAIPEFGRQAGIQISAPTGRMRGVRTRAVRGNLDAHEALRQMLEGTGLEIVSDTGAMIVLREGRASPGSGEAQAGGAAADSGSADGQTIVVVGTNIRGVYPSSSPVETYTAEDIARTSATTTEQFIQRLPQNLGTRTQFANNVSGVDDSERNRDAVTSVDLRGLGVGTTLTLMNGRRLGASDFGRSVDVSLIPVGAIERVEVLTDGASAIYGSDAIGGVVNFVLRRDFNGAETRLSYGGVTSGGLRQVDLSQTFGRHWNSGRGLVSYTYHDATALERLDRDYATPAGAGTLTPRDQRHNLLLTGSQDLGSRLTVSGDLAFARRDIRNEAANLVSTNPLLHTFIVHRSETDQYFANFAAEYRISSTLRASLQASYSQVDVDSDSNSTRFNAVPPVTTIALRNTDQSTLDVTAMLTGELFELPGGPLRFSIGGGRLEEDYRGSQTISGLASNRDLGRQTTYAFAEVFAPMIGETQAIPFVHRLELSLAARYTSYDDTSRPPIGQDFGHAIDPKIGLFWAPSRSIGFRATYGTSFRAPALTQIDPTSGNIGVSNLAVAGVPATVLITAVAPALELEPETAKTFTLGFDFRPVGTGLRISATYYNINYTDRIARLAGTADLFTNPLAYPDRIYRATSAAEVEQFFGQSPFASSIGVACPGVPLTDRNAVAACIFARPNLYVFDQRIRNLALSKQDGIDVTISKSFDINWGSIALGASVTHILNYRQRGSRASPVTSLINGVGFPVDLRGRAYATVSSGGFSGTFSINYVDGYRNLAPVGRVDNWITGDVYLAYEFGGTRGLLSGARLSLSVQNLFDEEPPFVRFASGFTQIGFDAANANPLGRLVVLGLTKTL